MRVRVYPANELEYDWNVAHNPAANVQATASRAAAGVGVRNVCSGFTAVLCGSDGTAPTVTTVTVGIRDGASGAGSFIWGPVTLAIPAVAGAVNGLVVTGLFERGSYNTAMTVEFSAAAGAHTTESVTMQGSTIAT